MNKSTILIANMMLLGLIGCSSGGSDNPPAANTAVATTGSTTGTSPGDTSTTSGAATGTSANGANPGIVPSPVLAEVTSLDVSGADSMRGHKVFAGNEIRGAFQGLEDLVQNAYFNFDFPCTGQGVFEAFPAPQFTAFVAPFTGNFTWNAASASDSDYSWDLDGAGILTGDTDNGYGEDGFDVEPIVNGSLIVGKSVAEMLVVTRIVQYDTCGNS